MVSRMAIDLKECKRDGSYSRQVKTSARRRLSPECRTGTREGDIDSVP
jgi:hypothetical protein